MPDRRRELHVEVDQMVCVGNGMCILTAPHTFAHDASRQSYVVDPRGDDQRMILDAAAGCPVGAIRVTTGAGEQLFPSD